MSEVQIQTPRGLMLSGTFVDPVDSVDCAVVFSHSLLSDRHSGGHFDRLAAVYRAAGYATLMFDYSGHGMSGDDIITTEHQVEDLRAASGWLNDQGFSKQLVHAHSFGTLAAMRAQPKHARSMILTGAVTGPVTYDWPAIFSENQLDDLERTGRMTVPDDSDGPRDHFTLSKQTLIDLSLNDAEDLLGELEMPVLVIHDADDEHMGLLEMTRENWALAPEGSDLETCLNARFGAGESPKRLSQLSLDWTQRHLPIVRGGVPATH